MLRMLNRGFRNKFGMTRSKGRGIQPAKIIKYAEEFLQAQLPYIICILTYMGKPCGGLSVFQHTGAAHICMDDNRPLHNGTISPQYVLEQALGKRAARIADRVDNHALKATEDASARARRWGLSARAGVPNCCHKPRRH